MATLGATMMGDLKGKQRENAGATGNCHTSLILLSQVSSLFRFLHLSSSLIHPFTIPPKYFTPLFSVSIVLSTDAPWATSHAFLMDTEAH